MPSRSELLDTFRNTATEVAERDFQGVMESSKIAELGIDSLGMLEIIGSLERELRIQIPDECLAGVVTVEDLLNAVESRKQEQRT
ncbi:MAG: acyl carrier protein [Labilithrix sp.]|nr:acyl carrier protein [Labilithrix sp.]MCW5814087.1 acyl carrier protein [Labilithrix sp.]